MVSCPALISNFACADLARCGSTIFVVCFVPKTPPPPVRKSAAMPDQHADHQHKRHGAKRGAQGNAGRRVGIAAPLDVVPNLSDANENQDERPIGPENRPWLKRGIPSPKQKQDTESNQDDGEHQGRSSRTSVLDHGIPPLPLTTHENQKKFRPPRQTTKRIAQTPRPHTCPSRETEGTRCCRTPKRCCAKVRHR